MNTRPCQISSHLIALILALGLLLASTTVSLAQGRPDLVWMKGSLTSKPASLTYSPDGRLIVTADGGAVKVFRVADAMLLRTFLAGAGVRQVSFSPDSTAVAAAENAKAVDIWQISDGKLKLKLTNFSANVRCLAFSPDGKTLATGDDIGKAQLWNVADGASVGEVTAHSGFVSSVAFSQDGNLLATGSGSDADLTAKIWHLPDLAPLQTVTGPEFYAHGVNPANPRNGFKVFFTPDGQRLLVGGLVDGTGTKVFSVSNGSESGFIHTNSQFGGTLVTDFSLSANGAAVVQSLYIGGNTILQLRTVSNDAIEHEALVDVSEPRVGFSPAGSEIVTGGYSDSRGDSFLDIYRVDDLARLKTLTERSDHAIYGGQITMSPDGQSLIAQAGNDRAKVRQITDGSVVRELPYPPFFVGQNTPLALSPDWTKMVFTVYVSRGPGFSTSYPALLNVSDGSSIWERPDLSPPNQKTLYSPDGKWIAIDGPRILNASDGSTAKFIGGCHRWAFSPDGQFFTTATGDGFTLRYQVFQTSDWTRIIDKTTPSNVGEPNDCKYSSDGKTIAIAGDGTTLIVDSATGDIVRTLMEFTPVRSVAFSLDGATIATAGNGIKIWRAFDGSLLQSYTDEVGSPYYTTSVAYSKDSKYFAFTRSDGTIGCALNPYHNSVFPNHGGNTGSVTVQIVTNPEFRLNPDAGAEVRLVADGQPDVLGKNTAVNNEQWLTTTFEFSGVNVGRRDIVIISEGKSSRQSGAFNIEPVKIPQLYTDVVGPMVMRGGKTSPIQLRVSNYGNVDAVGVRLWSEFSDVVRWNANVTPSVIDQTLWNDTRIGFDIPIIPPTDPQTDLTITLPADPQFAHVLFCISGSANDELSIRSLLKSKSISVKDAPSTLVGGLLNCTILGLINFQSRYNGNLVVTGGNESKHSGGHTKGYKVDLRWDGQLWSYIKNNFRFKYVRGDGAPTYEDPVTGALYADEFPSDLPYPDGNRHFDVDFTNSIFNVPGTSNGPGNVGTLCIQDAVPGDPNELFGPIGYAGPQWSSPRQALPFDVLFENVASASAPAAQVSISNHLDAASLDMATLTLSTITFGDQTITPTIESAPPAGAKEFNALVDLRPNKNLLVKINAKVDLLTGELKWTFTSLDPITMMPPDDPLAGFLDPGVGGSCLFTVQPKKTVSTGTVVTNKATIVFDFNDPMDTNSWFNTIDADGPISVVNALPATENTAQFLVSWRASDVGSGLRDVTITVSDNGGPFTAWLTNTTDTQATFTGQPGHTYAFKAMARDNVFNAEDEHGQPDTITAIASTGASDVTGQIKIVRSGFRRNNVTKRYVQDVTITNMGNSPITGPLSLVFDGLASGVSLFGPDGTTALFVPVGSPYKNMSVSGGSLGAGKSIKVMVEFVNPSNASISYNNRVLAGTGSR